MSQFTKILVATDGSPTSKAAVDRGLELASNSGASVTFLHVVEPNEWRMARGASGMPSSIVLSRTEGDPVLDEALDSAHDAGVDAEIELVEGDETRSIVAVADHVGADLIVLGRGRRRLKLRSVADAVVRRASCPVYVAHAV